MAENKNDIFIKYYLHLNGINNEQMVSGQVSPLTAVNK